MLIWNEKLALVTPAWTNKYSKPFLVVVYLAQLQSYAEIVR